MELTTIYYIKRKLSTLAIVCFIALWGTILSLTGCKPEETVAKSDKLVVVTTTTMLTDLVYNIGGSFIDVRPLMGPGVDPHLYQASAGDINTMQQADIIVYNGLHLEGKLGDILSSIGNETRRIVSIGEGLEAQRLIKTQDNNGIYDPHFWFDVSLWKEAAIYFNACLIEEDEKNQEAYHDNLTAYLKELDELELYIHEKVNEIPKTSRILITAHDAFQYFGSAYGFQVIGLQGISTDSEAGTKDVSELAAYIADHKIKAVFSETSVPPKAMQALMAAVKYRGFDTAIGGDLYSDSLGDEASGCSTYIFTLRSNIDTMIHSLK